jgi:hypothetical protein
MVMAWRSYPHGFDVLSIVAEVVMPQFHLIHGRSDTTVPDTSSIEFAKVLVRSAVLSSAIINVAQSTHVMGFSPTT